MVLNEKHDEQNKHRWLSRATRERLDLSASVEETLENAAVDELAWNEELDEQPKSSRDLQGKGVFPPRLSLQSRPVPALHPASLVEQPLSSYASPAQERKLAPAAQNTNMLRRFAQRLTSSFAALGGNSPAEIVESTLQIPQEQEMPPIKASGAARGDQEGEQRVQSEAPLLREKTELQRVEAASGDELREKLGKQRLAGRTTRIHLETPPARSQLSEGTRNEIAQNDLLPQKSLADVNEPAPYKENDANRLAGVSSLSGLSMPGLTNTTRPSMHVIDQVPTRLNTMGAHLPTTEISRERVSVAPRRELSGSGIFEAGQGEATVVNRYVTEASVVLVTLTGNPGPVVVQYVTLRPRIGFTVHLTAPTTMRAPFNYIVLLGELF